MNAVQSLKYLPKYRFMVGLQAKGPRQLTSLVTVDKHQNTAGLSKLAPGSMRTSAAMLGKSFRTQVTTSKAEFQIHYPAICVTTLQLSAQICLHVGWCCCGTPGLSCAGPCELMSVEVQTPLSFLSGFRHIDWQGGAETQQVCSNQTSSGRTGSAQETGMGTA